jgi:2,2-dialkylglycine decarboxylase (pyruvate)
MNDQGGAAAEPQAGADWRARADAHLIRYGGDFAPVLIERAEGCLLHTRDGRTLLDFTSGQMCATLGHNHPAVVEAMQAAARGAIHLYSGMLSPAVVGLAEELAALLPPTLSKVMLLSTGGEANEAAMRMAKLHTGRFEVVGIDGSWHGMTGGAVSSTYAGGRKGYGPALPGTLALPLPNPYRCPIGHCRERCDLACLEAGMRLVDSQSVGSLAAVIAEPILSSGGIVELPEGYLARLKTLCEERGMLLILDEAQTALGRVGALFAFEQAGVTPHLLSLSKTLGAGVPLSATVTGAAIEEDCYRKGFLHYTSHVSDPLPAEVGRAVLRVLTAENLARRATEQGAYLKRGLVELQGRHEAIGDVRGRGLLLGLELVRERASREPWHELAVRVGRRCLELGLSLGVIRAGRGNVFRVAPPLTVTREQIDGALARLDQALADCTAGRA